MARPLRIEYPDAVYHVTCRGNEQKDIFRDDSDRRQFLKIFSESSEIYSVNIYSYVLMTNHFHLLVKTPLGNLGEFMRRFNVAYTGYFNRRHRRVGHLYQGRYKSLLVDSEAYLTVVSRYIHLNPVRIKSFQEKSPKEKLEYLKNYQWSSFSGCIDVKKKEDFIDYKVVLEDYGGEGKRGRQNYLKAISQDIADTLDIKKVVVGQAILGSEDFVRWVVEEFLDRGKKDGECPPLREMKRYYALEKIIATAEKVLGKSIEDIRIEGGLNRQIVMDVMSRLGGMKGKEIGEYFNIDYSTVSVSRKRLREKIKKNNDIAALVLQVEKSCQ